MSNGLDLVSELMEVLTVMFPIFMCRPYSDRFPVGYPLMGQQVARQVFCEVYV